MPTASQLLFFSARRRLDPCDTEVLTTRTVGHLLQGLQNELVVIERVKSLTDAQVRANVRISELQNAASKVEEEKIELEKQMKELTRAVEEREKELKEKLAEEQKLKEEALEECKDVEAEITMFVSAQVSHQYLIQKLPESHFRGYMDSYLQIGSMSDLGSAPSIAEDAEVGEGSSKKEGEGVGDNVDT